MAKHIIPTSDTTRIEVHWQRDGGVQVASARRQEPAPDSAVADALRAVIQARTTGDYREITRAQDAYAEAQRQADDPEWSAQFVDLDRAKVNHLIKQLRVARDQAYGRDE
jgi:hypothetical protein